LASWILIPCLDTLFDEFDLIAPARDKASDGRVGDLAHQQEVSDHNPDETGSVPIHDADKVNEVHAIDVDNNLNESDLTMEKVVQFLLGRCRSGAEKRLRYIIYNRRIWSASSGWVQKPYTGASAHTEHAHFSGSYDSSLEASTASWHLEDLVAVTPADVDVMLKRDAIPNPAQRGDAKTNTTTTWGFAIGDTWAQIYNLRDQVAALGKSLTAAITALAGKDLVDEQALAAGLAALIIPALPEGAEVTAEQLQAAVVGALRELAAPAA